MIWTLLEFGTIGFWAFCITFLVFLLFITEDQEYNDYSVAGIFAPILFVGTLSLFGCRDQILSVLEYAKQNPIESTIWVAVYFILGILWSFGKWYFFVNQKRERAINECNRSPKSRKEIIDRLILGISPNRNKSRICNWIGYWPISVLWTLINEPIKKFSKLIYSWVEVTYDKISKNATKGLYQRLETNIDEKDQQN